MTTAVNFACLLTLWTLLISPHNLRPQPQPSEAPTFVGQGAFISLIVTNLDASLDWYKSNLDLHLIKRGRSPRVAAETAVLSGHNVFVELIHYTDRSLTKRQVNDSAPVAGPVKSGAIVDSFGFDSLAKHIQSLGIDVRDFEDKEMRCRTFIVRDADGNLIQFFAKTDWGVQASDGTCPVTRLSGAAATDAVVDVGLSRRMDSVKSFFLVEPMLGQMCVEQNNLPAAVADESEVSWIASDKERVRTLRK